MLKIASTTFITLSLLGALSGFCYAAPAIQSVSGAVGHGQTVTISGSGFGVKSPVAPLVWDNFEWGTNGSLITESGGGYKYTADGSRKATIDTSQSYGQGTRSAYNEMYQYIDESRESTEFAPFYTAFTPSLNGYLYLKTRWSADGTATGMWKAPRLMGTNGYYDRGPGLTWTGFYGAGPSFYYHNDNSGTVRGWVGSNSSSPYDMAHKNTWNTLEYYIASSNPAGTANGCARFWTNFKRDNANFENIVTRIAGFTSLVEHFSSGHMFVNGTVNQKHYLWVDDLYIDNTQARVMICNQSTWAEVANGTGNENCEIQIPTVSWSDTSLQVTINRGAFGLSDTAYVYVIDANGAVNPQGYPVVIGSSSSVGPLPPKNLRITN